MTNIILAGQTRIFNGKCQMRFALTLSLLATLIGCAAHDMPETLLTYSGRWECDADGLKPSAVLTVLQDGTASIGWEDQEPDEGKATLDEDGSLTVTVQTGPPERFNAVLSFIRTDPNQIQLVKITLYDLGWMLWGDPKHMDEMFFRRVAEGG